MSQYVQSVFRLQGMTEYILDIIVIIINPTVTIPELVLEIQLKLKHTC